MKEIDFEVYNDGQHIVSATNKKTNMRVSRMPARVLFELSKKIDNSIDKGKLVTSIWGNDNYFIRRTFDVHLNKVKHLLVGSHYKVVITRNFVGVYTQKEINKSIK